MLVSKASARIWGRAAGGRLLPWWRIVELGALSTVVALSPSTYRGSTRGAMSRQLVAATWPILLWFTLLSAMASLVITRIVLVTAHSYGLSQYALEMVVRVLVLELIPLTAALFVALRWTIPSGSTLAAMRSAHQFDAMRRAGIDVLRVEIVPRAVAGVFAVLLLAAISSSVALVLAYLMAHGFSPWGLDGFTRMVGRVFGPAVTLIFALKTLALSAAVSLIPIGSALHDADDSRYPGASELTGLVRMAAAILLVEVVSLMGNYN